MGAKCTLVTRGPSLLALASRLPADVAGLDILDRYAWAFEGDRVPNFVRLLAQLIADYP